ncbi:hypothetical protein TL16_g01922 [Triparma laevis f. inornata]|uniref:Uncharacterized protein n=1 Tax=Triparma laevis f. inornata TaxID=1714386 RepID=A0A9W6ZT74_9STRA|nr:hypothetical protein TL16_g01922 [Triparma laevis f. inornata]
MGGEDNGGDNEIWKELMSNHGVSESNGSGQVVVVTSQSESRAFRVLVGAQHKDTDKPLNYSSFKDGEVGVWCTNVALDGRGLMESVVLKSGSTQNSDHRFVYVIDVVSLAKKCPLNGKALHNLFDGLRQEINAAVDEIKKSLTTSVENSTHVMKSLLAAKQFPISPAHPLPSEPVAPLPLVFTITLDPQLFAATYTQKQALAYLTYMLRLYCHHLGASLVFIPDAGAEWKEDPNESEESKIKWEKNRERYELLQKFVMSFLEGGGEGGEVSGEFALQEEDELFVFVPTAEKEDHLNFLRSTASCKNAWDAEADDYNVFVSKCVDKTDKVFVFEEGGEGDEEGVAMEEKEKDIDKIASYEWMRSLQSNMESDTREVEKKVEKKPTAGTPEKNEDVSAFFTSLLKK